jgi:hypothetical protein
MTDDYAWPAWPDLSDYHRRLCAANAETSRLRAELAAMRADNERLEHDLAHLALHDGTRDARVGKPLLWRTFLGLADGAA